MPGFITRLLPALVLALSLGGACLSLSAAAAAPAAAHSCSRSIYPHSRPNAVNVYRIKVKTNPCSERISAQIYCKSSHRWRYGRIVVEVNKTSHTSCGLLEPIKRWGYRWQVAAGLPWTFHQVGCREPC